MAVIDLKDRTMARDEMISEFLEAADQAGRKSVGVRISLTLRDWRRDTYVHVPGVTQLVNIPPSVDEIVAAAELVERLGQLVQQCEGFVGAADAVRGLIAPRRG